METNRCRSINDDDERWEFTAYSIGWEIPRMDWRRLDRGVGVLITVQDYRVYTSIAGEVYGILG